MKERKFYNLLNFPVGCVCVCVCKVQTKSEVSFQYSNKQDKETLQIYS